MSTQKTAYELGVQLAYDAYLEKSARAEKKIISGAVSGARNFFDTLAGHNVGKTISEQHAKVMKTPIVAAQTKKTPADMSTLESYVTKALRSKKPLPGVLGVGEKEFQETAPRALRWFERRLPENMRSARKDLRNYYENRYDLPKQTASRKKLTDALTEGHRAIKKQRAATRNARLALGSVVAVPAAGAVAMAKEGSLSEDAPPVAAAGAAATLPFAQGLRSGALGMAESKGKRLSLDQLHKAFKPGDILLTSQPGWSSSFKLPIAAMGGDPYGYHVESVLRNTKGGHTSYIHSTPGAGAAAIAHGAPIEGQDVIIKRLKDQSKTKEFVKNLKGYGRREEVLRKMLGVDAPPEMYDTATAVKGGGKSFLPAPIRRLLFKDKTPLPGATVCSSLPGMACPVDLAPGVARREIMPHHLQRSAALETVGHYRAPRKMHQKAYEGLLRASPWITRGALGAGLGYGAYKGMQHLMAD